jgi:hypothetical protein
MSPGWDGLPFSILCDLLGGPIAGLLVYWYRDDIISHLRDDKFIVSLSFVLLRSFLYCAAASSVIIMTYLMFVHPIPEQVVLDIKKQHSLTISYAVTELDRISSRFSNVTWTVPMEEVQVSGGFAGLTISAQKAGDVKIKVVMMRNCKSDKEAVESAKSVYNDSDISIDMAASSIDLRGLSQTLKLMSPNNDTGNATISVPHGSIFFVYPRSDSPGRLIRNLPIGTRMDFAAKVGTLIIVSGNVLTPLEIDTPDGKHDLALHEIQSGRNDDCRPIRLMTTPPDAKRLPDFKSDDRYILDIISAQPQAEASIRMDQGGLELPRNGGLVPIRISLLPFALVAPVNYLEADIVEGTLAVGTERYELATADTVVLGSHSVAMTQEDDGTIVIRGQVPYILLNGRLLTRSIFGSLPTEIQVLVITGLVGPLAWVGRRKFGYIIEYIFK